MGNFAEPFRIDRIVSRQSRYFLSANIVLPCKVSPEPIEPFLHRLRRGLSGFVDMRLTSNGEIFRTIHFAASSRDMPLGI